MNSYQKFSSGAARTAREDLFLNRVRLFAFVFFLLILIGCKSKSLDDAVDNKSTQINASTKLEDFQILSANEPIWNLGEVVVKGGRIDFDHEFVLKNNSSTHVEILDVKSTCGCLVAKDYQRHISPGDSSNIKVTMSVFGPPGTFKRQVTVIAEGKSGAVEIPLIVKGRRAVSDMLYTTPGKFTFGKIPKGEIRTRIISLARFDGTKVSFDRFESSSPALDMLGDGKIDARTDPFGNQINCVEVTVQLDTAKLPLGNFVIPVTLTTSLQSTEGVTSIRTNAVGQVVQPDGPWVKRLLLKNLLHAERVVVPLIQSDYSGSIPRIDSVSFRGAEQLKFIVSEQNSQVTANHEESKDAIEVYVIFNNSQSDPPLIRGELEIFTTPQSKEPILIPVYAFPPVGKNKVTTK